MKSAHQHTPSGKAITILLENVFRMNGAILAVGDGLVADLGLTSARWQVLGTISSGDASVSHIARRMGLARQGVQRIANRLHDEGFVETRDNPDHARAKLYTLTAKGREIMEEVNRRQFAWANDTGQLLELEKIRAAGKLLSEATLLLEKQLAGARAPHKGD